MGDNHNLDSAGPSERERFKALYDHMGLFEMIADFPPAGVHEKFLKEWALATAYVEGKVFQCWRSLESSVKASLVSEPSNPQEDATAQVTKSSQIMGRSPLPSVPFMDLYRAGSGVVGTRAANGELAYRYGRKKQPVPPNLGAMNHEDLEPMTEFVWKWIANPINEWLVAPSKKILYLLPMYKDGRSPQEDKGLFDERSIQTFANGLMNLLVTSILIVPIATFNVVESQTARIVVMPLFCLLLLALAQYMGPRSSFIATLATAYFQAMVIYVGTTSDR
ncbi:hypothetical protein yc1106_04634 [Curvularia clavata]|uniref:DUF6594 domain-containing protein n=1 Tax=Curvularia clavata TaxID=95742 RepID=A0A9Q8Z910_CURCL|nr:hypothetical protein yc1106_04634 [Curvularia clavata]